MIFLISSASFLKGFLDGFHTFSYFFNLFSSFTRHSSEENQAWDTGNICRLARSTPQTRTIQSGTGFAQGHLLEWTGLRPRIHLLRFFAYFPLISRPPRDISWTKSCVSRHLPAKHQQTIADTPPKKIHGAAPKAGATPPKKTAPQDPQSKYEV